MAKSVPAVPTYFDQREAAKVVGMEPQVFAELVRRGEGPAKIRLGHAGTRLFRDDQLLEWIARRRQ